MKPLSPQELQQVTGHRYDVETMIGVGGMGAVYRAVHRELGSKVAIKILLPDRSLDPTLLARFKREASLSAQASHPNVVPVFELNATADVPYLVMPYIEGESLEARLQKRGNLSADEVHTLVTHVGHALTYAHDRGVVHRDVKPANVLFEAATRRWLLTDFGIAHVAGTASGETDLTGTGATIGTLRYLAPEQLGGARDVDGRADLYALALTAYEALVGYPADRDGPETALRRLRQARPDVPSRFAHALTRALATATDERPSSVAAWLDQLEHARIGGRIRRMIYGVGALAAVIAAGFFFTHMPSERSDSAPVVAVLPFDIRGSLAAIDLGEAIPQAVAWQVKSLSGFNVLEPQTVRSAIAQRTLGGERPIDSLLLAVKERLGATLAVVGWAAGDEEDVALRMELYDTRSGALIRADEDAVAKDSLHALVSQLVVSTVGATVAEEQMGAVSASLPLGVAAVAAYLDGDRALRRGDFERAVAEFDRVIALDSSFAPVRLKRVLASAVQLRPSQAVVAFGEDLEITERQRERLDPVSRQMLDAYILLQQQGDLRGAAGILKATVDEHPDATYSWVLLGMLHLRFSMLLGTSLAEARNTLHQVLIRDDTFAAVHGLQFLVALNMRDRDGARSHLRRFLAVDSTSVRADLMRVVDSLVFDPTIALSVLRSFPDRPVEFLEYVGLTGGDLHFLPGARSVGLAALRELARRAATPTERATVFRMQVAMELGSGRAESAVQLIREAVTVRGVPRDEVDRWMVLSHVVPVIPEMGTAAAADAAAARLAGDEREPAASAWTVARWHQQRGETYEGMRTRLSALVDSGGAQAVLARSLIEDLEAQEALAVGDTVVAIDLLRRATGRYSMQDVTFGPLGALWPLQLALIRIALAWGDYPTVEEVVRRFDRMAGFVDQVAWSSVLLARADAALAVDDVRLADSAFLALSRAFREADGAGASVRDSAIAWLSDRMPQ